MREGGREGGGAGKRDVHGLKLQREASGWVPKVGKDVGVSRDV